MLILNHPQHEGAQLTDIHTEALRLRLAGLQLTFHIGNKHFST